MKITMTNAEMAAHIELLAPLNESGRLGYGIARNLRRLKEAATEYLELRARAFQTFGTPVEAEGQELYRIPADKIPEANAFLGEIPGISHEVEIFTVPEETFFGGKLTSGQMERLLWMVEEPAPAEERKEN